MFDRRPASCAQQVDEYRTEVKRLARSLAAARGGNGGPGRVSAGFNAAQPFPWMNAGAGPGDTVAVVDRTEEGHQDAQVPVRGASAAVTNGWYLQAAPPPPRQFAWPSSDGWSGRGVVEAPQRSPNETNAGPLLRGEGRESGRSMQPPLAWEATVGAAIRESSGASGGVRRGDLPRDASFGPRTTDVLDDLGLGLAVFAPSAAAAVRGGSPRRRKGPSSARVVCRGSPRGSRSPDRWSANGGENSQLIALVVAALRREDGCTYHRGVAG